MTKNRFGNIAGLGSKRSSSPLAAAPTSSTTGLAACSAAAISTRHHTRKKALSSLACGGTFLANVSSSLIFATASTCVPTSTKASVAFTTAAKSRSSSFLAACASVMPSSSSHCSTAKTSSHTYALSSATWARAATKSRKGARHVWLAKIVAVPTAPGDSSSASTT